MISDLPHALASVLSAVERDRLGYVLYRDPKSDQRLVILVETPTDLAAIETVLRTAGAETRPGDSGHDFIIHSARNDGVEQSYVIQLKSGSSKTNIANLLWLAATEEGAQAARDSVRRDS